MAYVVRLAFVCLLFWCGAAGAVVPKSVQYWNNAAAKYPTAEAFCTSFDVYWSDYLTRQTGTKTVYTHDTCTPPTTTPGTNGVVAGADKKYNSAGTLLSTTRFTSPFSSSVDCGANSTAVTGGCQCTAPYVENAAKTSCELPPNECEKLAGKSAGNRRWDAGAGFNNRSSAPHYYCDGWNPAGGGKCVAVAGNGDAVWTFEDGHWWGTGTAVYTGATASTCDGIGGDGNTPAPSTPKTPDGTPPKNPDPGTSAPAPCPTGQAAGEYNGTRVCAPTGSDTPKAAQEGTEKKNPDGSTVKTDTQTKCDGVKCTVEKKECTTAAGASTADCKTTTSTSDQSGFCNKSENGGNKVCQGQGEGTPTSFGGTCASGFTAVSDDAVINAMAAETFRQNCKVNPDDASQVVGKAEAAKTGNQTGSNPNNGSVSIGPGSFDSSNALGSGASCIADQSVTVLHWTATLPFSKVCSSLDILGLALLAVSSLLAARIVARG